jgi:hypothetical protein
MNRSLRVVLPFVLALAGIGALPFALACSGPPRLATPPAPTYPIEPSTGSLVITEAVQSGAMGDIHDFAGAATHRDGTYYGASGGSVRLDSEGSGWWVMSRLDISGDLAGDAFAPGTHRVYASGISDDPGDTSSMTVTGCSGPSYGDYTFDTQASTVDITVSSAGTGQRRIEYATTYGGQVTHGSFVYQVPASTGTTTIDGRGI